MEDMLLREIEKTGKVLEAILLKLGVTTREKGEEAYDTARTGLREGLGMDFDAVLGSAAIAGALLLFICLEISPVRYSPGRHSR